MPCSTTVVGVAPQSQNRALKCVTWHDEQVVAVGGGVAHLGDAALGRVVLEVDRRHVAARPAAEPVLGQVSSSCGRWRITTSTSSSRSCLGRDLDARRAASPTSARGRGRRARGRARPAPGTRGRPGRTPSSRSRARARAGSSRRHLHGRRRRRGARPRPARRRPSTAVQARVAGDRALARPAARARRPRRRAARAGRRQGASATAGPSGRTSETTGVPTAAARCAGPVLPTTSAARAGEDAGQLGERRPAAEVRAPVASPATRAVSARSPGAAGDDHAPPGGRERGDERGVALRRPGPRRAPTRRGGRRRTAAPPDGRGRRRRPADAQRGRRRRRGRANPIAAASDSARSTSWTSSAHGVADVEQRAGVVDRDRADPRHARQAQQRARAAAGSGGRRSGRAPRRPRAAASRSTVASTAARVDGPRVARRSTARVLDEDLVDAGQQPGRLARRAGRTSSVTASAPAATARTAGRRAARRRRCPGARRGRASRGLPQRRRAAGGAPAARQQVDRGAQRRGELGRRRPPRGRVTASGRASRARRPPARRPRRRRCRRRRRSAPGATPSACAASSTRPGAGLAAVAAVVGAVRADEPRRRAARAAPRPAR